jgi:hypothetical protein
MKKFAIVSFSLFLAAFLTIPAQAQEAAKKTATKPAPGTYEGLLKQWNNIGRKSIAMAEDFPSDKYDFKAAPTPAALRNA